MTGQRRASFLVHRSTGIIPRPGAMVGRLARFELVMVLIGCSALLGGGRAWADNAQRKVGPPLNLAAVAKAGPAARRSQPRSAKPGVKQEAAAAPPAAAHVAQPAGSKPEGRQETAVAPPAAPQPILQAAGEDVTGAVSSKDAARGGKGAGKPPAGASENDTAQFCSSVADAATDARLAWQMQELQRTENALRERIAELEAKRAEYEKWLKLREDFLKKAEDNVVEIYSRMRPEAAATQLAAMVDETAAAVLAKLTPRNSSAILNEMEPARAAHLANTLAGMRSVDNGKAGK